MSTLEIQGAVNALDDLLSEFGSNGEFWSDDEIAEAFREAVPDIMTLLDYVQELL